MMMVMTKIYQESVACLYFWSFLWWFRCIFCRQDRLPSSFGRSWFRCRSWDASKASIDSIRCPHDITDLLRADQTYHARILVTSGSSIMKCCPTAVICVVRIGFWVSQDDSESFSFPETSSPVQRRETTLIFGTRISAHGQQLAYLLWISLLNDISECLIKTTVFGRKRLESKKGWSGTKEKKRNKISKSKNQCWSCWWHKYLLLTIHFFGNIFFLCFFFSGDKLRRRFMELFLFVKRRVD